MSDEAQSGVRGERRRTPEDRHAAEARIGRGVEARETVNWRCAWCRDVFDVLGGVGQGPFESDLEPRHFCVSCWSWVCEMREYRADQARIQEEIDARRRNKSNERIH